MQHCPRVPPRNAVYFFPSTFHFPQPPFSRTIIGLSPPLVALVEMYLPPLETLSLLLPLFPLSDDYFHKRGMEGTAPPGLLPSPHTQHTVKSDLEKKSIHGFFDLKPAFFPVFVLKKQKGGKSGYIFLCLSRLFLICIIPPPSFSVYKRGHLSSMFASSSSSFCWCELPTVTLLPPTPTPTAVLLCCLRFRPKKGLSSFFGLKKSPPLPHSCKSRCLGADREKNIEWPFLHLFLGRRPC